MPRGTTRYQGRRRPATHPPRVVGVTDVVTGADHPAPPPPLTLWANAWRLVLVLTISLGAWLATVGPLIDTPAGDDERLVVWFLVADPLIGIACLVLVAFRRRMPVTVAAVTAACSAVSTVASGPATLALCSVAARRRVRELSVVGPLTFVAALVYERVIPQQDPLPFWGVLIMAALFVAVVVAVGVSIGSRRELMASLRERAETNERAQQARIASARAAERTRIAREMHDVLAHRISLVSMHAGALTFRDDLPREEQVAVARTIQDNAHLALQDLRDVLGVLRDTDGDPGSSPERPQPGLGDVSALVDEAAEAGVHVVASDLTEGTVPATTGRTAYRIVQEGLTNARKHAPGARVTVSIEGCAGQGLDVRVVNPAAVGRVAAPLPTSGLGLLGLTERVELVGGTLTHGWDRGAFVVHAWLPWSP